MGAIIVISGPVGAGKTTVARELLARTPPPAAFVEGDAFWPFVAKPRPQAPRQQAFQTIMKAMFRSAAAFASDGFTALLDFSMPPTFLERASARVSDPIHFVVLKPALAVCTARAAERVEGRIDDYEPYAALYDLFQVPERHVLANDELAPAAAAAEIAAGVRAGRFRYAAEP